MRKHIPAIFIVVSCLGLAMGQTTTPKPYAAEFKKGLGTATFQNVTLDQARKTK